VVGGFNTNVRYRGRTLHVQTEDSGPTRPYIVTLVYEGGTILYSRKQQYGNPSECGTEVVRDRMEAQHRDVVVELKAGRLDEDLGFGASGLLAHFGDGVLTGRTLDEIVLSHLES
jgi:hypothetical protein